MEIIHQPVDFLGVNYYVTRKVWFDHNSGFLKLSSDMVSATNWDQNAIGGGIYPPGLTGVLLDFKDNYGISNIYITENGIPLDETPGADGNISDSVRIQYISAHLSAAHDAIKAGVNLKGYYVWSLMDNFEWAHGTSPRFGLVWTDFRTKKRVPKLSAYWYRDLIANNCLEE
jgi:beta-glucosidase